jgi:TonB family protein
MIMLQSWRALWLGALFVLAATAAVAADDSLATARDLYAAAAYEDALAVLNRLGTPAGAPGDGPAIGEYRAFCLLALGRVSEAEQAIETLIAAEPSYHPSDSDASPRIRSAFSDVRRRMLPAIVQQQYAQAKAAYDKKEFGVAAEGFKQVVGVLNDPDLRSAANQPPLSDLRMLATGFGELSASAAAPPPLPLPSAPVTAAEQAQLPGPARPAAQTSPAVQTTPAAQTARPVVQSSAVQTTPAVQTARPAVQTNPVVQTARPAVQSSAVQTSPAVPASPQTPPGGRIYTSEDGNVVPPAVVRQSLPPFTNAPRARSQGTLAIVIDESGAVETASMLGALNAAYDRVVLEAARQWRYKPATLDGVPVRYRRIVQINLVPSK